MSEVNRQGQNICIIAKYPPNASTVKFILALSKASFVWLETVTKGIHSFIKIEILILENCMSLVSYKIIS